MANSKIEKKLSGSKNDRYYRLTYVSPDQDNNSVTTAASYNSIITVNGKNKTEAGGIITRWGPNNYGIYLESVRTLDNTRYAHNLKILVDNSGNPVIECNQTAWKNALNYVSRAGDTMTGQLVVQQNGIWVQGGSAAGSNNTRMTMTSGMPTEFKYNNKQRGVYIYSNAIAIADPYNGNTNNDAAWFRHIEETSDAGYLEIGIGDGGNEPIYVRRYNTNSVINKQITLLDASGNTEFPGNIYGKALHLFPNTGGSFDQGIRIHPYNNWSVITLCGTDNTGDTGTSANTWAICNYNGNFYLSRNGTSGATTYLKCIDNIWSWNGTATGNISGTASNVTGTIAIDHGGTGATSAQVACRNLGSWVTSQGPWSGSGHTSVTFTLNNYTWNCGLVIGNTNGGGNFLYYIQLHNANTVYLDRISTSTNQAGTITASLSGANLTFTAATGSIKYITLVGLII